MPLEAPVTTAVPRGRSVLIIWLLGDGAECGDHFFHDDRHYKISAPLYQHG
ncbi:hypothetical protein ACFSKM_13900 [Ancylobacter dichloromethanicus]